MDTEDVVQIYQLVDPRTGNVFYVGQTKDPQARLSSHIRDAIDTNKRITIKEILASGEEPEMIVIANVPESVANEYEELIIKITKGLVNKAHNAKGKNKTGIFSASGKRVELQRSSAFFVVEEAIKNNYRLSTRDRSVFIPTKDVFDFLIPYCGKVSPTAAKMIIGKVMTELEINKTKRRVNGKRVYVYEGLSV